MHKSVVFPYGITFRERGRVDTFPATKVLLPSGTGEQLSFFLLVDSGASLSALPAEDAETLGINLRSGLAMKIHGVGKEPIIGWRHKIKIYLGSNEILVPIVLLENYNGPRILGRDGVFDRFLIVLNESKQRTGFICGSSKEEEEVEKIIDQIE